MTSDELENEYLSKTIKEREADESISFSELIEKVSDEKREIINEALEEIAEEIIRDKKPLIVEDGVVQRGVDNPDYWFLLEDD